MAAAAGAPDELLTSGRRLLHCPGETLECCDDGDFVSRRSRVQVPHSAPRKPYCNRPFLRDADTHIRYAALLGQRPDAGGERHEVGRLSSISRPCSAGRTWRERSPGCTRPCRSRTVGNAASSHGLSPGRRRRLPGRGMEWDSAAGGRAELTFREIPATFQSSNTQQGVYSPRQ